MAMLHSVPIITAMILVTLVAVPHARSSAPPVEPHLEGVADALSAPFGSVHFDSSCSTIEACRLIETGMAQLHLFFFDAAVVTFHHALMEDPQCTMAHWGSAMAWFRPLWWAPNAQQLAFSEYHIERAKRTISSGRATEREQRFVQAAEKLFLNHTMATYKERVLAYESAAKSLLFDARHGESKAPIEETAAYALAALGKTVVLETGDVEYDQSLRKFKDTVGMILEDALASHPHHCGALHFLLHAYDNVHRAKRAYAYAKHLTELAPKVPHARHMPVHIYVRLGHWEEAALGEAQSLTAVLEYMQTVEEYARVFPVAQDPEASSFHPFRDHSVVDMNDTIGDYFHSLSYLLYALEQLGRFSLAEHLIEENLLPMRCESEAYDRGTIYTFVSSPARLLIESEKWEELSLYQVPHSMRNEVLEGWAYVMMRYLHLTGLGRLARLHSGSDVLQRVAEAANATLSLLLEEFHHGRSHNGWFVMDTFTPDWRATVDVQVLLSHANVAWIEAYRKAKQVDASSIRQAQALFQPPLILLKKAADLEDRIEKPTVKPSVVYPARQQLADRLLELEQHALALDEYLSVLEEHPRRFGVLLGLARSARALGQHALAAQTFRTIVELCTTQIRYDALPRELCDPRVVTPRVQAMAAAPECDRADVLMEARTYLQQRHQTRDGVGDDENGGGDGGESMDPPSRMFALMPLIGVVGLAGWLGLTMVVARRHRDGPPPPRRSMMVAHP